MKELVDVLNKIVPTYPQTAASRATAPYAVYDISDTPIRTKDGIAGYEGTLTLTVFASSVSIAKELAGRIITAVDSRIIGERRYYYADTSHEDYPDEGISSSVITFNTL